MAWRPPFWRKLDVGAAQTRPPIACSRRRRCRAACYVLAEEHSSILLKTMFDLPGLEGVEQVVISREAAEGTARPLYVYADRPDH
jgi:ATP-dependent protease Clp ATPase subunit